jgi:hypothetical protein
MACRDLSADVIGPQPPGRVPGQLPGKTDGIFAYMHVAAVLHQFDQTEKVIRQTAAKSARRLEIAVEDCGQILRDLLTAMQAKLRRLVHVPGQISIGNGHGLPADLFIIRPLADFVQNGLDVLAGTELVGEKIRAGADIGAPPEAADGHPVLPAKRTRRRHGRGLPGAEPGFAAQVFDLHLRTPPLDAIPDGGFGGGQQLSRPLLPVSVGIKHRHLMAADRLAAVQAIAFQRQRAILGQADFHLDRQILVFILHLTREYPRILIDLDHAVLFEIAQALADGLLNRAGLQRLAVEIKGVFMLRRDG